MGQGRVLNETNETNHELTTLTKSITITLTRERGGGREGKRGEGEKERARERENGAGGREYVREQVEERFVKMDF